MSTIDFKNLNTLEGFKDFLQAYHAQLSEQRSFPPLGIQKALHTAAPIFGHNDWHVMSVAEKGTEQIETKDEAIQIVSIVINEINPDNDEITYTDTTLKRGWDKAKEHVAELVYNKALLNDRSVEEIMECRGVSIPDCDDIENFDDLEIRELVDWIVENNSIYDLARLVEYLDFNQIKIDVSDSWV